MEKYRNSISEIIASVAEKYEPSVYQELSIRYRALIKILLENSEKYIRSNPENTDKPTHKKLNSTNKTKN